MKILIAEDDPTSRLLLTASLQALGHEVVATADGLSAWEQWQQSYFPVLITDWAMPRMDGLTLSRAVRQTQRNQYTCVILLTALEGRSKYLEAMDAGADDFITKPFDQEQLAARLTVAGRMLGLRQHVTQLEGLLPICAYCKKIRDEKADWEPIEKYIAARSKTTFTHGICPACMQQHFNVKLGEASE